LGIIKTEEQESRNISPWYFTSHWFDVHDPGLQATIWREDMVVTVEPNSPNGSDCDKKWWELQRIEDEDYRPMNLLTYQQYA
jgi:hypothetical protein